MAETVKTENQNQHKIITRAPSSSPSNESQTRKPKRFIKNQIPDSITNNASLNAAISLLPSNYTFEVHKCVWRILSTAAKRVALQFPEGLLMYSLHLSDIFRTFADVDDCFVLGDVTYGACCVDDFSASALGADLLIHYGHSCLVPIDSTTIPCIYVFVDIKIDVERLIKTIRINLNVVDKEILLAGTIQFALAIRAARPELEKLGFKVLIPQAKPLSAGEVLGCTAPKMAKGYDEKAVLVFVADGRFHLEAFMIANPGIKAFRYDPYIGTLFLEEYDHIGMKDTRRNAILKAKEAKNWGIVLGTLGRQGNPRILDRLEKRMSEKGYDWTVILMSEISPTRMNLFEDSVDAWIQIACPRLSIDWGEAFQKPLLTPFEAEIAFGYLPGWWEKKDRKMVLSSRCEDSTICTASKSCCRHENGQATDIEVEDRCDEYPMDYYSQDGGEWNSSYTKKKMSNPALRRTVVARTEDSTNQLQEIYTHLGNGKESNSEEDNVSIAGRIVACRAFGKLAFLTLRDDSGTIQLYCEKERLSDEQFEQLKSLVDVGDIVGASGSIKRTEKGELSVYVKSFSVLTKSLLPLPDKFHGLTDVDKRYRQRLCQRYARVKTVESTGFVEVETPVLQGAAGGAEARPFVTFHNSLGQELYLRIATELHLKRMLVGGFEKVYEIGRIFRNEGISTRHNPEFTTIEMYEAYSDYQSMMNITEEIVTRCAVAVQGKLTIDYQGVDICLERPWRRKTMHNLVKEATGIDFMEFGNNLKLAKEATLGTPGIDLDKKVRSSIEACPSVGHILNEVFESVVESKLIQPTFVLDYPIDYLLLLNLIEGLTERFELFVRGRELANAFSELTDPMDQGLGIDRLVMLLTNSACIQDVIAFPVLKIQQ